MQNALSADQIQIDRTTSRTICHAVGERLRQNMRPEESHLPAHLRNLMDELRRQDLNGTAH